MAIFPREVGATFNVQFGKIHDEFMRQSFSVMKVNEEIFDSKIQYRRKYLMVNQSHTVYLRSFILFYTNN